MVSKLNKSFFKIDYIYIFFNTAIEILRPASIVLHFNFL